MLIDSAGGGGPACIRVEYLPAPDRPAQRVGSDLRPEESRKIASPLRLSWNTAEIRGPPDETKAFIASKKPRIALHFPQRNGAAQREAKLILVEVRPFLRIEEIPRLHSFVPVELVSGAMQPVGAGFGDYVNNPADRLADFGSIIVRLHVEFADDIYGRSNREARKERVAVVNAVHKEQVAAAGLAIDAWNETARRQLAGFRPDARCDVLILCDRAYSWCQGHQLSEHSSIERQIDHLPGVEDCSQTGCPGLQHRRNAGDLYFLLYGTNLQSDVLC